MLTMPVYLNISINANYIVPFQTLFRRHTISYTLTAEHEIDFEQRATFGNIDFVVFAFSNTRLNTNKTKQKQKIKI